MLIYQNNLLKCPQKISSYIIKKEQFKVKCIKIIHKKKLSYLNLDEQNFF